LRGWLNSNWLDVLISVLVAIIDVAIIAPWILLLLLSTGQDGMSPFVPIGVGVIGVVSFWVARELLSKSWDLAALRMASLGAWLVMFIVWFGLVTDAGFAAPLELIDRLFAFETGAFGLLILGAVAWWRALTLASTEDLFEPDFVRSAVMRTVVAQVAVLIVSAMFWTDEASPIQALAAFMIPLGFAACLVAATAIQVRTARLNIRAAADQRLPGRGWLMAGGGIAGAILLFAALIAMTAGREAWQIVIWPIVQILRGLNWVLDWIILGVALIGYILLLPLFWVVQRLVQDAEQEDFVQETGDVLEPAEDPPGQMDFIPEPVLQVLQWVVVAVIIALVVWFAVRQLRRMQKKERDEGETELRESMFSRDALMSDLSDMLGGLRRGLWSRRTRFNLRQEPASVREAYQHVMVHASRQGVPRQPQESPRKYAQRLSESSPDVRDPVDDLTERYIRARYGDLTSDEDIRIAREDWDAIRHRLRRQG
jgi:large-conductance mechanosensitive channel